MTAPESVGQAVQFPRPVTLRCNNLSCRVESYAGTTYMPLNMCPSCLTLGAQA